MPMTFDSIEYRIALTQLGLQAYVAMNDVLPFSPESNIFDAFSNLLYVMGHLDSGLRPGSEIGSLLFNYPFPPIPSEITPPVAIDPSQFTANANGD